MSAVRSRAAREFAASALRLARTDRPGAVACTGPATRNGGVRRISASDRNARTNRVRHLSSNPSSSTATTTTTRTGEEKNGDGTTTGASTNRASTATNARANHGNTAVTDVRSKLMSLSLRASNIHEYGWTRGAIAAAASDYVTIQTNNDQKNSRIPTPSLSISGLIHPNDLITTCMKQWNERLRNELREKQQPSQPSDWNDTSRLERIEHAIRRRLEMNPYSKSSWQSAMALGTHPSNVLEIQHLLKEMVEIIVQETTLQNDSSSNLSEMEKLSLGGIFVATELHWLATPSNEDDSSTWIFLHERLQEWDKYRHVVGGSGLSGASALFSSDALYAATNIATAFGSGALSLLMTSAAGNAKLPTDLFPTSSSPFASPQQAASAVDQTLRQAGVPPPEHIWNFIFGEFTSGLNAAYASATTTTTATAGGNPGFAATTSSVPGTHPSDYESK